MYMRWKFGVEKLDFTWTLDIFVGVFDSEKKTNSFLNLFLSQEFAVVQNFHFFPFQSRRCLHLDLNEDFLSFMSHLEWRFPSIPPYLRCKFSINFLHFLDPGSACGFLPIDPQRQYFDFFSLDICRPIRFSRTASYLHHDRSGNLWVIAKVKSWV